MTNCYFVWNRTNGILHAQKDWGEFINAETGKERPFLKKIKLTAEEKLFTIDELELKYPLNEENENG